MDEKINKQIKESGVDTNLISDGYHTFGELYEHRIALFIVLCRFIYNDEYTEHTVWKSRKHSDGTEWEGWFIAGIDNKKGEQISYHLPIEKWDLLKIHVRAKAPVWDGHTPNDVIERLLKL